MSKENDHKEGPEFKKCEQTGKILYRFNCLHCNREGYGHGNRKYCSGDACKRFTANNKARIERHAKKDIDQMLTNSFRALQKHYSIYTDQAIPYRLLLSSKFQAEYFTHTITYKGQTLRVWYSYGLINTDNNKEAYVQIIKLK